MEPFGFINAFKPVGVSSAAFGSWVKRLSGASAVGHWGTLDPSACGVLVLALGRATRLLPLLPHARKQYVFELIVGSTTDSGDRTGSLVRSVAVPIDWRARLPQVLRALIGTIEQTPPMHSALKVDGRPLYRSARAGIEVPRPAREVGIYQLRALDENMPTARDARRASARIFLECDAGTYVRVLCEDIGRELGLPAHMGALVRVAAGNFSLADAWPPDHLQHAIADAISDPLAALTQPRIELDAQTAARFLHGNEIDAPCDHDAQVETLVLHAGRLLGSGRTLAREGQTMLAPVRVLVNPSEIAAG